MGATKLDTEARIAAETETRAPVSRGAALLRPSRALLLEEGLVACLLLLTFWIGVHSSDFVGLPKGGDALDHAATVRLLMHNFPHLLWNPAWFGGLPFVPGLYPPLYDFMIAAIVSATGLSIQHAMVACTAVTYLVMVASLYGFVRVLSKSRAAAFLAGLLVLAVPGFWEPSLQVGEYPRLIAMGFASVATFLAALYTSKPSRTRFTLAVLAIGCALSTHPITGALGALQVLGVLLLVPYRPRRKRVAATAAAAAFMVGLAAWLYVPSLVGVDAYYIFPQARFTTNIGTSFGYLFYPPRGFLTALSPLLLPLAVLLLAVAVLAVWRRRGGEGAFRHCLWASVAMMVVVVCVLAYAYVGRLTHAHLELVGVYPFDMFSYAAWPLAAASALLLAGLLPMLRGAFADRWRLVALAGPYAGAIACLVVLTPVIAGGAFDYHNAAHVQAPLLPGSNGTQQYRIGLTDTTESSWINVFTRTPELGGPFNQGALDLDYIGWEQSVLVDPSLNLGETRFIAQWNAIRWIQAQEPYSGVYQANPRAFRYLGSSTDTSYLNYEVGGSGRVFAATNTPPVLVIAPYADYNLVLRCLAITDVGPKRVIPLEGTSYIDDYSLSELEQSPVLFLYGFKAHDPARAARLLADYVRAGGGLIADVAGDTGLATELAKDGAPMPAGAWAPTNLHGSWGFRPSRSAITRGIDLAGFSPAVYGRNQPYLVEAARRLAPGSAAVLTSGHQPLLVDRKVGNALVVESGLNLPYHDAVFSNSVESSLLARIIVGASDRSWLRGPARARGVVVSADSERLRTGSADGVLFKETDTPDWHATVNGHGATIYPAGPGYMYVRLSSTGKGLATVTYRYQLSATEWASIVVSLVTLILLLAYLAGLKLPRRRARRHRLAA